eukprot:GHVH01016120.1.p1 GENE.GHVH01016120.1~~GHVH01016120.1.p1  ORF type:complete len:249 (-),score=29.26 GHVH01016120.1:205-951(-)
MSMTLLLLLLALAEIPLITTTDSGTDDAYPSLNSPRLSDLTNDEINEPQYTPTFVPECSSVKRIQKKSFRSAIASIQSQTLSVQTYHLSAVCLCGQRTSDCEDCGHVENNFMQVPPADSTQCTGYLRHNYYELDHSNIGTCYGVIELDLPNGHQTWSVNDNVMNVFSGYYTPRQHFDWNHVDDDLGILLLSSGHVCGSLSKTASKLFAEVEQQMQIAIIDFETKLNEKKVESMESKLEEELFTSIDFN